jgi:predicted phosphodiesterase
MRCLIISDIHANAVALDAVLADAAGRYDAVWCLGDVVSYGPDPNTCIERLRALPGCLCLAGNHDWAVLNKLDLYSFNPDARTAVRYTQRVLTPDNHDYLDVLMPYHMLPPFTLAHGSPRHPIWEYILDSATAAANFEVFTTPLCLVGHTHSAVIFRRAAHSDLPVAELPEYDALLRLPAPGEDRLIINPGSVGQPRDSDPRAAYGLLDTDAMTYEPRRIGYDIVKTQEAMRRAGLPPRLIARLQYGW